MVSMGKDKEGGSDINTYDWKAVKVCITPRNVDGFVVLANRRDIRGHQVKRILRALENGDHFEAPFVANKLNGKYRLIDGNHRLEAIRRFLAEDGNRAVEVEVKYYEDLSEEEERQRFKQWNAGLRQTTNDYLRQYWEEIPIFKHMAKEAGFPVQIGVQWSVHQMEARLLLSAYFSVRRPAETAYSGPATYNGEVFVAEAKKLKQKTDVTVLRAFLLDYIQIFGQPDKKALAYRTTVFCPLADIWMRNYAVVPSQVLLRKLEAINGSERMHYWAAQAGAMMNCMNARKDFLAVMNTKHKTVVLV